MTREPQPASDTVDGLGNMLVDRYREALREAMALLRRIERDVLLGSYSRLARAFLARPDIVRLLAGEPVPVSTCSHCFCLLEADESATCCRCGESPAPTCDECGGSGHLKAVELDRDGADAWVFCPRGCLPPVQTCRALPPNAANHLPDCRWYPAPSNRGPYWGCADGCNAHRQPAQPEAGAE